MGQFIVDMDGKRIEVTNLPEAIKQAKMFTTFDVSKTYLTEYWKHTLAELQKLTPIEPIEPIKKNEAENEFSVFVAKVREERRKRLSEIGFDVNNMPKESKLFTKDGRTSPLYGLHSCAKVRHYINKIDSLKIGESCVNGSGRRITRIF